MNFESIARKACERHDYVRAVVTLSRGLKRLDDVDCEALDLLIDLYANCCQAPGLEREVADIIVRHFDASLISGQIIACLDARELGAMSRVFRREIASRGVLIEEVSLESLTMEEEREEVEDPHDASHDEPLDDALSLDDSGHLQTPEEIPHDQPELLSLDDDEPLQQDDLPDEPLADELSEEIEREEIFEAPRAIEWTDEHERDVLTPALQPLPVKSSEEVVEPESSAPRSWRVPLIVLCVCLASVAAFLWLSAPQGAQVKALEQQLEAFDTLNPSAFELLLGKTSDDLSEGSLERMEFARMLLALERGEVLPSSRVAAGEGTGVWGRGASVFQSLQRRDIEAALAHVEAMERRTPDSLATFWTRARLEEERGRFGDAQKAYALATHRAPRFLPGLMGAVRVAFYQGDNLALEHAQAALREVNPQHPYLEIKIDVLQKSILHTEDAAAKTEAPSKSALSEVSSDRFARAYSAYLTAYTLRERGDLSAAHAEAREALSLEPFMSPALLLQGSILAAQLRVEDASAIFARYASLEQLDVRARLALMVHAPRALTRAGRPDLALIFALDPGGESPRSKVILAAGEPLVGFQQQWRPISLNLTREQRDANAVPSQLALAELAWALVDLGAAQDALQVTRQLNAETYPFLDDLQWFSYYVMGATQRLTDLAYQHRSDPVAPYPALLSALSNGELMQAHGIVMAHPEVAQRQMLWLRAATLAQLVATPGEDVLASLDRVEYAALPGELARQRMRVWSMLEPTHKKYVELREAQLASDVTSLHALIDLAYTFLWQPDLAAAMRYATAARSLAPEHAEVVYFDALVLALNGDGKGLRELLKGSELSELHPVWLLDVGELAIRHGQPDLAYEYLSRLKQAEEVSPALLDRLGRASMLIDSTRARMLWAGLEGHYQKPEQAVHLSKALRWMAVTSGSRKGQREANVFLDRALALEGVPQDELWLEQGRYFVAIQQNKRARDSFAQALRYNSSLAGAHAELANLALASGQTQQARDHLIKYLGLRPYGALSTSVRQKLDALQVDPKPSSPPPDEAAKP